MSQKPPERLAQRRINYENAVEKSGGVTIVSVPKDASKINDLNQAMNRNEDDEDSDDDSLLEVQSPSKMASEEADVDKVIVKYLLNEDGTPAVITLENGSLFEIEGENASGLLVGRLIDQPMLDSQHEIISNEVSVITEDNSPKPIVSPNRNDEIPPSNGAESDATEIVAEENLTAGLQRELPDDPFNASTSAIVEPNGANSSTVPLPTLPNEQRHSTEIVAEENLTAGFHAPLPSDPFNASTSAIVEPYDYSRFFVGKDHVNVLGRDDQFGAILLSYKEEVFAGIQHVRVMMRASYGTTTRIIPVSCLGANPTPATIAKLLNEAISVNDFFPICEELSIRTRHSPPEETLLQVEMVSTNSRQGII